MKRIIALIIALTVIISILNISAFADGEAPAMTSQEYRSAQSNLIDKYCNGEITFLEWQERQTAVNTEYLEYNQSLGNTAYAFAITTSNQFAGISEKFANAVQKWGDGARERVAEWWNNVCNSNNVPTESTQTSTIDMQGYGAVIIFPDGDIDYCQYVIRNIDNLNGQITEIAPRKRVTSYGSSSTYSNSVTFGSNTSTWKYYGDIRWSDGTPAPTDDEYITGSVKKFDEMPDKDLEDLLEDFAEEMERQNPDLSTIEGLLKAIYARMGTLDSDNDNDLLNAINANILALVNADKDKDEAEDKTNEELVNTLLEIRDSLKNGTLGTAPTSHGHEISGTVYNVIPLDKDFIENVLHDRGNLKVNYQGQIYYLENCGCLKLGDKYYTPNMNYEEYSAEYYNIYDLPSFTFDSSYTYSNGDVQTYAMARNGLPPVDDFLEAGNSVIQPYIDKAVNEMAKAFTIGIPYDDIKNSIGTFQSIVFNNHKPKDVVITMFGKNVTILSAEFNSYLTGGVSSGGGNNNFNYGDLISGGNSSGGSEHGGGGSGGNLDNNSNSSDIVAYSDDNSSSASIPALATYVKIARSFSSILIGFSWALSMRKKIVAMI